VIYRIEPNNNNNNNIILYNKQKLYLQTSVMIFTKGNKANLRWLITLVKYEVACIFQTTIYQTIIILIHGTPKVILSECLSDLPPVIFLHPLKTPQLKNDTLPPPQVSVNNLVF